LSAFVGDDCGTPAPPCYSNPCHNNGNCTDSMDSYSCTCPDKFTGIK
jgi:hypothetical protein